jgi:hypothetical protein
MSLYFIALEKTIHTYPMYLTLPGDSMSESVNIYFIPLKITSQAVCKKKEIYSILDKCQYAMGSLGYLGKRRIDP